MENLIEEVRLLIDDATEPYDFTDEQVERYINKYRRAFYDKLMTAESDDYIVYSTGYKNLANFSIADGNDNEISASEYTLDQFNGIVTFTEAQDIYLYATFTCHDLRNAAADIWKVRAAQATTMGSTQVGDQKLPKGKESVEFCIKKYWELKQGRSFLMER